MKKILHLRTSALEYVNINSNLIPLSASVTTLDTIPTMDEITHMVNPPLYIYIPNMNQYYELKGKRPNIKNLEFGELAVSFKKDYEGIIFKNNLNELVEIKPNNNIYENVSGTYTFYNPEFTYNGTGVYLWRIPYKHLMNEAIFIDTCMVSLREVNTGKQIVGDITFNAKDETIDIIITNTNTSGVAAKSYIALCTVLHEKVSNYISCEMITKEYDNLNTFNINSYKREYIVNHLKEDIEFIYTSDKSFTHLEHYMLLHNTTDDNLDVTFAYLCNDESLPIICDADSITIFGNSYCEVAVLPISTGLVMTYSHMLTPNKK